MKNFEAIKKNSDGIQKFTGVLFFIYLAALVWILMFKLGVEFSYMDNRNVNLTPFKNSAIFSAENVMNAVIFVPLGIYAGLLFRQWSFAKHILFYFLMSLFFEGLQYILRIGAFDITDLITNFSGGVIGLIIFRFITGLFSDKTKVQKFINAIAAIATVIMIVLLVLLKMNLLPIRYQ